MTTDMAVVQTAFDYGELDVETRIVVQQRTEEIRTLVRRSAQDIIDIGTKLTEVKARLGHGNFGPWLEAEFGWGVTTAWKFMQVADKFSQSENMVGFAPSALYLLAAPSTPEEAREEALERAAAGETITHAAAKEIVAEHKQPQAEAEWRPLPTDFARRVFGHSEVPAPVVLPVVPAVEHEAPRYNKADAPLKNDLTPAEIEAFLRSYWSERELAQIARSSTGFDLCRRLIVSSGRGRVDNSWRWDTTSGKVYVWLASHGADYWRREPDAVFTYDRLAKMTLGVLPVMTEEEKPSAPVDEREDHVEFLAQSKSWTDISSMSAEAVTAELQQYLDDGWERWPAAMGYGWEIMVHPERKLATAEHYGSPSLLRVMRQGKYSAEDYEAMVNGLAAGDDLALDEPTVTEVSPVDKNELFTEIDEAGKADNWVDVVEVDPVNRRKGDLVVDPEDFEYIAEEDETVVPVSQRDGYDGDEWYTPLWLVKLVRDVMGGIDLDPASCEMAQTVVHADGYLTRFDDGLQYRWEGRVFINPPYSMPAAFIAKLQEEVKARRTTEAVVLVNNATETSWFQTMLGQWTVCFLNRRLAFWRHDHADVGARQGQAVFYYGPNVQRFEQVFAPHGTILRRVGVNSYEPV